MNLARSLSGQIEGYFETAEQTANNIENHLNHNQSLADNISYLNSILENNNRFEECSYN